MSDSNQNPDKPIKPSEALAAASDASVDKPSVREKAMGFWEHLDELRGTIIKSLVAFIVCASIIGFFMKEFYSTLLWPMHRVAVDYPELQSKLGVNTIMEVFNVVIQLCVWGGAVMAAPFILYFIAQFVSPALTEKEMKAVRPLCVSALILFLIGASFGFFLLMPSTIRVATELNNMFEIENRWTVGSYYSTLTWLVVGAGGVFEFPLVIILLVWLGIMTTAFLRKYRRHAIVAIFIIAAIVTPTPDPFTQTMFAIPLYALYEISILVSARVEKRKART